MVNPNKAFDKKAEELTDLQQKIVKAIANNPSKSFAEIADEIGTSEQYVSACNVGGQHLIEELRGTDELDEYFKDVEVPSDKTNAHGKIRVEGPVGTFEGEPLDMTEQYIGERPVKFKLTDEQEEFLDNLDETERVKRILRAKARNPDLTYKEVSNLLDEKLGTVSSYLSMHRDKLQEVYRIGRETQIPKNGDRSSQKEEIVEEVEEPSEVDGLDPTIFNTEEVIDILSSDVNREIKRKILESFTE